MTRSTSDSARRRLSRPSRTTLRQRLLAGGALLLALLVPGTTLAASTTWTRQFGTASEDAAGAIAADTGGVTVVGTTGGALAGPLQGASDAVIRRYDGAGRVVWTRQFGTSNQDSGHDVAADSNGITVLGATDGSFSGGTSTTGIKDLYLRRYDYSGKALWTRQFGTSHDEDAGGIAAYGAGLIVVGTTYGALAGTNTVGDPDAVVRRYDFAGRVVWTRQFGTREADSANAVAIDSAGFTVGGGTDGNLGRANAGPYTDAFIRRYDFSGRLLWTRQWGQQGDDEVLSVAADGTGITAVGYTHADAHGEEPSDGFVRRYDRAGRLLWSRTISTANSEIAWGISSDSGGLTVAGYTLGALDGTHMGSFDAFVRRYDRGGELVWATQFGTPAADLALDVAADSAGFTVAGHTTGSLATASKGELDLFVRRYLR